MAVIGVGVSHKNIFSEDWMIPWNLASGIVKADEGKPVALDTSAARTVKLAGDGDPIIGKLMVVEDRAIEGILVGTVAMKGAVEFTKSGAVNIGDQVQGAGSGAVKTVVPYVDTDGTGTPSVTATSHEKRNVVTYVGSTTVEVILF